MNWPEGIRIQKIATEIDLQERVVRAIEHSVEKPTFFTPAVGHEGYRFTAPGWRHFCLLKSVRAVSGLSACVRLYGGGFTQEIAVLLRTIAECTSQIDYIVAGFADGVLAPEQQKFVEAFFADSVRGQDILVSKPHMRQGDVHKAVGAHTDELVRQWDTERQYANANSAKLLSSVYIVYSNFVHSRYPEVMDLFGGNPPRFHLRGMRGTPRDLENLDLIETFTVTISNALRFVVMIMNLRDKVLSDAELARWFPPQAA